MVKIGYAILAHTDPIHIARLAHKVTDGTENVAYIHVDGKVDISPFLDAVGKSEQIFFLQNRIKVNWGGFSSILATLSLFERLIEETDCSRVVILQGLDYLLWSNEQIDLFFLKNSKVEFIRAVNETMSKNILHLRKYCFYYFMDDRKSIGFQVTSRLNGYLYNHNLLIPFKRPYIYIDGRKLDIYRGWAHFSLTREAIEYILDFTKKYPKYNRYFKHSVFQDEAFFHTIIFNSKFVKQTELGQPISEEERSNENLLNLTFFNYDTIVRLYKTKDDYDILKQYNLPYFRKASSESNELLDFIDKKHKEEQNI